MNLEAVRIEHDFMDLVVRCDELMISLGYSKRETSPEILEPFRASLRQNEIIEDLRRTNAFLAEHAHEPEIDRGVRSDLKFLKRFMADSKLRFRDSDFAEKILEGDVIEVYGADGIQIYRNWVYFKICPYTIAEILAYHWNELYARPSAIVQELLSYMVSMFQPTSNTLVLDIPEYAISARMVRSATMLMHMKYISPLVDEATGLVKAIVVTCRLGILDDEAHSQRLDFI